MTKDREIVLMLIKRARRNRKLFMECTKFNITLYAYWGESENAAEVARRILHGRPL